jgi:ariadne-1
MRWNKEKLIEKYMDNPDAITVAAGIAPPKPKAGPSTGGGPQRTTRRTNSGHRSSTTAAGRASPRLTAPGDSDFLCPICFDDSVHESRALGCGHRFCTGCWTEYTTAKIRAEGEHAVRCMAEGCAVVAPDAFVQGALAGDAPTWARFRELLVRDFVGSKRALKFCPYPGCSHTVACAAGAPRASLATQVPTVTCGADARHVFCFGCDVAGDHRPVVCAAARLWLKKCADDSETANWIKTNTKECSKCDSTIEKNGGCNHMTCKKCKWEFCWVCMGPWSEHGSSWYSCNRFDEKAGVDARDAQAKSRASLERYLHVRVVVGVLPSPCG